MLGAGCYPFDLDDIGGGCLFHRRLAQLQHDGGDQDRLLRVCTGGWESDVCRHKCLREILQLGSEHQQGQALLRHRLLGCKVGLCMGCVNYQDSFGQWSDLLHGELWEILISLQHSGADYDLFIGDLWRSPALA